MNRSEGRIIRDSVALQGIACRTVTAISRSAFEAALFGILPSAILEQNAVPVVHLSCHGSKDGISLSNGDFIAWKDLKEYMAKVNSAINGLLILCMSCCEGFSAIRMAMDPAMKQLPFFALVSNMGKPTWGQTAVAFSSFYLNISSGVRVSDAVERMKTASGNDLWVDTTAFEQHLACIDYLKINHPELLGEDGLALWTAAASSNLSRCLVHSRLESMTPVPTPDTAPPS